MKSIREIVSMPRRALGSFPPADLRRGGSVGIPARFNAPKGIRLFSTAPIAIKIKHPLKFL